MNPTIRVDGQVAAQIVPSAYAMTKNMTHSAKSTNTKNLSSLLAFSRSRCWFSSVSTPINRKNSANAAMYIWPLKLHRPCYTRPHR